MQTAQNTVERRAHLVAHDRQQARLGLFTGKGPVAGFDEFLFGLNTLGNVPDIGDEDLSILAFRGRKRHLDREKTAGFVHRFQLDKPRVDHPLLAGAHIAVHPSVMGRPEMLGHDQLGKALPDRFFRGIAEDALSGPIEIEDNPVLIDHENAIKRRGHDRAQMALRRPDFRGAPLSFRQGPHQRQHHADQSEEEKDGQNGKIKQGIGDARALRLGVLGKDPHPRQGNRAQILAQGLNLFAERLQRGGKLFCRAINQGNRVIEKGRDPRQRCVHLGVGAHVNEVAGTVQQGNPRIEHVETRTHIAQARQILRIG